MHMVRANTIRAVCEVGMFGSTFFTDDTSTMVCKAFETLDFDLAPNGDGVLEGIIFHKKIRVFLKVFVRIGENIVIESVHDSGGEIDEREIRSKVRTSNAKLASYEEGKSWVYFHLRNRFLHCDCIIEPHEGYSVEYITECITDYLSIMQHHWPL